MLMIWFESGAPFYLSSPACYCVSFCTHSHPLNVNNLSVLPSSFSFVTLFLKATITELIWLFVWLSVCCSLYISTSLVSSAFVLSLDKIHSIFCHFPSTSICFSLSLSFYPVFLSDLILVSCYLAHAYGRFQHQECKHSVFVLLWM